MPVYYPERDQFRKVFRLPRVFIIDNEREWYIAQGYQRLNAHWNCFLLTKLENNPDDCEHRLLHEKIPNKN